LYSGFLVPLFSLFVFWFLGSSLLSVCDILLPISSQFWFLCNFME
jgi:hypothetical protein